MFLEESSHPHYITISYEYYKNERVIAKDCIQSMDHKFPRKCIDVWHLLVIWHFAVYPNQIIINKFVYICLEIFSTSNRFRFAFDLRRKVVRMLWNFVFVFFQFECSGVSRYFALRKRAQRPPRNNVIVWERGRERKREREVMGIRKKRKY